MLRRIKKVTPQPIRRVIKKIIKSQIAPIENDQNEKKASRKQNLLLKEVTVTDDKILLTINENQNLTIFRIGYLVSKENKIFDLSFEQKNNQIILEKADFEKIEQYGKHVFRIFYENDEMPHTMQLIDEHQKMKFNVVDSESLIDSSTVLFYSNLYKNLTIEIKKEQKYIQEIINQISSDEQAKLREYYATQFDKINIADYNILYEVRDGTSFTDSPRAIFNYLIKDERFKYFEHIIVYDKEYRSDFERVEYNYPNVTLVERNTFSYIDAILSSKYLFNNSTFNSFFIKKKEQVYINTWHGTPLKYMGDAYVQDMVNAQNVRRNFLMTDYLLSPNSFTTRVFLEDYKLNELWDGVILENGLPRNELSQYQKAAEILQNLKKDGLDIDSKKPNYIYMPTWQGNDVNDAKDNRDYLISLIEDINEIEHHYNFLVKVHPFVYKELQDNEQLKTYLIPNKYDCNEIFKVTDLLITDYSSVLFDFLVTKKPMIFFNWDSDIYKNDRGSYIRNSELPGPNIKDVDELKKTLNKVPEIKEKYDDVYEKFRKEFVPNEDEMMIEEYVEAIFYQNFSSIKCIEPTHGKKKLLFHAGALMDNGITSSFLNLINQIDYTKYDVTIFLHDSKLKEIKDNWARLHPASRKMFKPGLPVYKMEENIRDRMLKNNPFEFDIEKYFPEEAYSREARRLFGNSSFDVVIDFSGYSYFWAKYLVALDAKVKICYMHNDLYAETNRKVNGKYPLRNDLLGIFSLYSKFDYLASVSEALNEVNKEKLSKYVRPEQMIFINNSININRVLEGNTVKQDFKNPIQKVHGQLLLESDTKEMEFKHTLEQGIHNMFTLTLNSSQLLTKAAQVEENGQGYVYVLVNNLPVGWTELSNFGNSGEDFEITSQKVEIKGYFIKEFIYSFKSIEDRIFNNSQKIKVKKYDLVEIESVVKILGSEYYKICYEKNIYFTNVKNIRIMEVLNVESNQKYLYKTPISDKFSKFGKIKKPRIKLKSIKH
jgi:CDP-glycerol glycerophosphotransferase